jgi:penicillin-insensitive murein endopeptidase
MRLLDRQARLLDYLTSSSTIFGGDADAPLDQALHGIDLRLLRLEARFSHEKRMEKIIAVFPNTFRLLGPDRATIVREFVNAFPPADSARMENARQFYDFLCDHWRNAPPEPPYLNDVAACEFACAGVRGGLAPARPEPAGGKPPRPSSIRRNPNSVLLRCGHDVRTIFEDGGEGGAAPTRRDTLLATFASLHGKIPERIFVLGDTGRKNGGQLLPHRDHQNGLSVDIFMPVRKGSQWLAMPTAPWNGFGYGLKFDASGRNGDLTVDFGSVADLLAALDQQGRQHGLDLVLIKVAPEYVAAILRASDAAQVARLKDLFVPETAEVQHTQHLHVDFKVKEDHG